MFLINIHPEAVAIESFDSIVDNAHELFEVSPPNISEEEAITNFKIDNTLACLFYSSSKKTDSSILAIEQNIAISVYTAIILAEDLETKYGFEPLYVEDLVPFFLLKLWTEIISGLAQHQITFTKKFPSDKYFYSNRYIYNINYILDTTATSIIFKLNNMLGKSFTVESLMDNSIFQDKEIQNIIILQKDIPTIPNILKHIA